MINDIESKTKKVDMCVDKILDLNILDPAMGSGHFLVGVVNYMAKRICKIEYGDDVTEESFIERKRDVARRCVYGVDLNPLAVDLAAVSLWLETLASDRPLSFLSAHLKAGNSLIGSSINDILDKQTTLVESPKGRARFKQTVRDFIMLETLEDDSAEAVRTKVTKYTKMKAKGTVYRDLKFLLNAKVAALFGVDVPPLADYATKIGENSLDFYVEGSAWQKAEKVACEHSFFHWDLEFPDVFYDRDGKSRENPGFDAVIGNPPYVRQELIKEKSALQLPKNNNLCQPNFVIPSKADRSVYFYYHSLNVIRNEGKLGFITSDSWMSAMYGKSLQEFLLQTCNIVIIMKTKFNVFSADTKTVTLVLNKKSFVSDFHHVKISYMNSKEELVDMKSIIKEKLQNEFVKSNWNDYFVDDELQPKINMIEMSVAGKIKRGKVTGYKDFFVMSSQNADKHHIAEKYRCQKLKMCSFATAGAICLNK